MRPFSYSFKGANEALVEISREILKYGKKREMNGFQASTASSCYEFPGPVMIEIQDPTARQILIPERKWNKILPAAESLWILLGSNNLDELPGHYVSSIYNFSDDGHTWRGGYGPRVRAYTGVANQYGRHMPFKGINSFNKRENPIEIDQLRYVVDTLKKEPTSRQALITIHDPAKDSIPYMKTKDIPCTRSLHFMIVDGKLNLYTWMRSNDLMFGFSAVNLYNFTFMQQYVAKLLGIPVGSYWHIADNLHYYENKKDLVEAVANSSLERAKEYDSLTHNDYLDRIESLDKLDTFARSIYRFEEVAYYLSRRDSLGEEMEEKLRDALEDLLKEEGFQDPFLVGWACAFPLGYKTLRPTFKKILKEKGLDKNKIICQFFV